jgi:hypothetical protein
MGQKIIGLLVSIGLIIGGASGGFVLRGTNSSTALIVAGVVFLIFDIYSIATHDQDAEDKERKRIQEESEAVRTSKYAHAYPGKRKGWAIFWWLLGCYGSLGLHNFYLGEKKTGIFKLIAGPALFIFLAINFRAINYYETNIVPEALLTISIVAFTSLFIWNIVDLVIIFRLPKAAFEGETPDSTTFETEE